MCVFLCGRLVPVLAFSAGPRSGLLCLQKARTPNQLAMSTFSEGCPNTTTTGLLLEHHLHAVLAARRGGHHARLNSHEHVPSEEEKWLPTFDDFKRIEKQAGGECDVNITSPPASYLRGNSLFGK